MENQKYPARKKQRQYNPEYPLGDYVIHKAYFFFLAGFGATFFFGGV